jgi:hypothetical protein
MGERLAAVGLEGSEGLLTKVARAIRAAALRTVAAGVALAIVGALFLVGGLPPMGGRQESVTPLGALAVIVGALALASALVVAIVGLCWLGRARRVNRRPTEPDLAQHST